LLLPADAAAGAGLTAEVFIAGVMALNTLMVVNVLRRLWISSCQDSVSAGPVMNLPVRLFSSR
jgi:hypothetical protein